MDRLGSKQPYEEYYIEFDFSNIIGSASIATASVAVYDSSGATCTSTLTVVGNQTLATSSVYIWVRAGETGIEYHVQCRITTSALPQEHYELDAILPVEEIEA